MTHEDLMPSGKYEGTPISEVPAYYLLWLHRKHRASAEIEFYILMNWDDLQIRLQKEKKTKF